MSRRRETAPRRAARGFALLAMLAVLLLAFAWILFAALAARGAAAQERAHNAEQLNRAKQALLAWVAMKALDAQEDNPGRLPCPEAAGYVGDPNQEGKAAGSCTQPKIGRLPWRTLGLPRLLDAAGEPLWYVTSPGWAMRNATDTLAINSNSRGQLTVDGAANAAIALIIAPGAPLAVAAAPECAPRNQSRGATPPDFRDYLECANANSPPDAGFASGGPAGSFNDQVLAVSAAEVLPGIEAALAARMQRDLAPLLAQAARDMPGAGAPLYPFAADWAANLPGTVAIYGGSVDPLSGAGLTQGLLPLAIRSRKACEPDPTRVTKLGYCATAEERLLASTACIQGGDEHCDPDSAVRWAVGTSGYAVLGVGSGWQIRWADGSTLEFDFAPGYAGPARLVNLDCASSSAARISCRIDYGCALPPCDLGAVPVVLGARTSGNAGLAFRRLNPALLDGAIYRSSDIAFGRDGAARVATRWLLPAVSPCAEAVCASRTIEMPSLLIEDNVPLQARLHDETAGAPRLRWLFTNQWLKLAYYAVSPARAPGGEALRCDAADRTDCLSVAGTGSATLAAQEALLVLAGRALAGVSVPRGSSLADYFEGSNADRDARFERKTASASFNDRLVLIEPRP